MQDEALMQAGSSGKPKSPMSWGDYAVVYVKQALALTGEVVPDHWWPLLERYAHSHRALIDAAMNAAFELFGGRPCADTGKPLYKVEKLTLKESAVACRMDLTHPEKLILIRPLREKRRALSVAVCNGLDAKWRAGQEQRIAAATAETMALSDADRD